MTRPWTNGLLLGLLLAAASAAAFAGPRAAGPWSADSPLLWLAAGPPPGLDDAVSRARRRVDGRVLSAETRERDGARTHDIRILTEQGRVRRLRYDAETGEYLPPGQGPGRPRR